MVVTAGPRLASTPHRLEVVVLDTHSGLVTTMS